MGNERERQDAGIALHPLHSIVNENGSGDGALLNLRTRKRLLGGFGYTFFGDFSYYVFTSLDCVRVCVA